MLKILKIGRQRVIKRSLHSSKQRYGYIVLVPEIGEEGHSADLMVRPDGLPAFNDITIENCLGTIGQQAAAVEKLVKCIEKEINENGGKVDPKRMFMELDEVTGPLDATWGIAKAIYLGNSTLIPTKSYMNIHERARNVRASKFGSKIIYDALNNFAKDEASLNKYDNDDKRLLQKFLLEGRLNGLSLKKQETETLSQLISQLGKERTQFKNKVNMAIHTFSHVVKDFELVREFPTTLLEAMAKDPSQPLNGPWKISLQPQIVDIFLNYCPDRSQRWNIWQANVRKASTYQDKSLENSVHIEKIRSLRLRQAQLLGFPNYATLSLETKSVGSIEKLKNIFNSLLQYAGPAQSAELEQLQQFASKSGFEHKLEAYDIGFWRRKMLLSHHQVNEEKIREFFPLPRVFSGLFSLSEKLFNIKIEERKNVEVWQPTVRYFDVYDCDMDSNNPVGGFYVDCYSKEYRYGKTNGWMVGVRSRNQVANQTPLCALIFNFTEPVHGKPYLLNLEDLNLIFKTFGSALQHLLTKVSYSDLSGLSNIEWDASQVSGHVMSNLLSNENVLKSISGHYGSDDIIPDDFLKHISYLKTNMAGYKLCQELYYADLDIELHQTKAFWLDIVKKLWPLYNCLPLDKKDSHPCSMTEIFSGDWAAAQFSHLYSKILAADISNSFEQTDSDVQKVGKRFKNTFLALGGSVPSAEVFRRFSGRDPSNEALLKLLNLYNVKQTIGDL